MCCDGLCVFSHVSCLACASHMLDGCVTALPFVGTSLWLSYMLSSITAGMWCVYVAVSQGGVCVCDLSGSVCSEVFGPHLCVCTFCAWPQCSWLVCDVVVVCVLAGAWASVLCVPVQRVLLWLYMQLLGRGAWCGCSCVVVVQEWHLGGTCCVPSGR